MSESSERDFESFNRIFFLDIDDEEPIQTNLGDSISPPNIGEEITLAKYYMSGHTEEDEPDEFETQYETEYEVIDLNKEYTIFDAEIEDEEKKIQSEISVVSYTVLVEPLENE